MKKLNELLDLSGKIAVVTGGAKGIGYGIAYRLAEAGATVVITDIDQPGAEKAASELTTAGFRVRAVAMDVARESDVQAMTQLCARELGGIDILVNNAGIYPNQPLANMQSADFGRVIDVNLGGVFLTMKYVSDLMKQQGRGGKIINITSIDALHPSMIGLAHYDASKHGVWGLTKNAALELSQYNIQVNALAPGGVATPGVATMQANAPQPADAAAQAKQIEDFMARIPMHRMGEADEIGKVTLFLASDMSSYMTGSQVVVDGGALLA